MGCDSRLSPAQEVIFKLWEKEPDGLCAVGFCCDLKTLNILRRTFYAEHLIASLTYI